MRKILFLIFFSIFISNRSLANFSYVQYPNYICFNGYNGFAFRTFSITKETKIWKLNDRSLLGEEMSIMSLSESTSYLKVMAKTEKDGIYLLQLDKYTKILSIVRNVDSTTAIRCSFFPKNN